MEKLVFILFMGLYAAVFSESKNTVAPEIHKKQIEIKKELSKVDSLYQSMNLKDVVNYKAFAEAMEGYQLLPAKNKDILSIIDFTLASTEKRLVVLDIKNEKSFFIPLFRTVKIAEAITLLLSQILPNLTKAHLVFM